MTRFSQPVAAAVLLLCLTLSATAVEPSRWNQWRGPHRDGTPDGEALPKTLSDLELVWERDHAPSYSGPIIHDGLVYTTETVDRSLERVTAYRIADGTVQWTTQWPGSMAVPFFAAANGDWIRSTPACSDDALVVVGMRDVMVCLDPQTGEEKWRVDFVQAMESPLPMFGASCSPLIDGDRVYMQTGGATVCLSLSDGSLRWKTLENAGADTSSRGAFSSPVIATLCGVRQLLVQTREELCGVNLESGDVLWREPIEAYRGMNILTPLPIGDRVFTSAHSGKSQLFEITRDADAWRVSLVWEQKQQAYMSSPVLAADRIFMHLKNERMTALEVATGREVFTSRPVGKYASLIADPTTVLALTETGTLMSIDATSEEFRVRDEVKVGENTWAHLGIAGEHLVVRDLEKLKVFRIR
ncbi:PQQ-binding-like beta-propeller repeat protein [Roseiconus nitratireducens]|uniref:PQQ-binding-like beta-propeller repeat protein n=1 Tax=Roseiconus nitratireducens TaxID=2605748 RepID=A0A5M6CW00_9BACT|nr:PQQ-binding-like beta-propeller repeat protein [Roseiconus nitratireducens]KAA5538550.1 PQQ-binding-like beta-propeller repeat protein [Roseiconus nitratireducens]